MLHLTNITSAFIMALSTFTIYNFFAERQLAFKAGKEFIFGTNFDLVTLQNVRCLDDLIKKFD